MKKLLHLKIFAFILFLCLCITCFAQVNNQPQPAATNNDLQQKVTQLQQLIKQAQKQPEAQANATQATQTVPKANKKTNQNVQAASTQTATAQQQVAAPQNVTTGKKPDLYDEAFSGVVNRLLPMSPKQIGRLREAFDEAQRAAAKPPGTPPKPTSSSVLVNLAPQATPPIIRLRAGYITSLVFMDSTGQPWPIAAYSLGDPTAFNIQWDQKGNTLLVQSVTFYKRSNLAVILKGLNTPVMLTLLPGQNAVDYRVDLRVPGLGPNAMFMQNGVPEGANPILIDVLNGIPPKGSKTLRVSGGAAEAWLLHKTLFLRTSLDVISPAWKSIMTSMDGTHAYELQPAPVILVLEHGKDKPITLRLEGWE